MKGLGKAGTLGLNLRSTLMFYTTALKIYFGNHGFENWSCFFSSHSFILCGPGTILDAVSTVVKSRVLCKSSWTYKLAAGRDIKPKTTQIVHYDNYYKGEVQGSTRAYNRKTWPSFHVFWETFLRKCCFWKIKRSSAKSGQEYSDQRKNPSKGLDAEEKQNKTWFFEWRGQSQCVRSRHWRRTGHKMKLETREGVLENMQGLSGHFKAHYCYLILF